MQSTSPGSAPVARRPPGRVGRRFLAVVIVLVVALPAYGAYVELTSLRPHGEPTITVYTYASFLGGSCGSPLFDAVFGAFGRAHGVHVQVLCPAGTLVTALANEQNAPVADVVIGLDEVTAPQADRLGLLVPYVAPGLAHVPAAIVGELSPDHAVTPYEYGYLAIDYTTSFAAATHGAIASSAFPQIAANLSWARGLMIEDPPTDITGEELLAWQVAFYQYVLHQPWQSFWNAVDGSVRVAPDWSTAFGAFTSPGAAPAMVVSYLTDPAYAAFTNSSGAFNATVSTWNGTQYGWRTIYGAGIVRSSPHLALDRALLDWLISGAVQSLLPTSEWEIPANVTVPLPAAYAAMPNATLVRPLNDFTTPNATDVGLHSPQGWLDQWQGIANTHP
ncbi:MAG: thiamine ABC transporter substrate-binding protein [Thermoplasmata archaeon]|nr:thiamine ABC transporter substrate-binding protein [Thermoplasmata archaeon]